MTEEAGKIFVHLALRIASMPWLGVISAKWVDLVKVHIVNGISPRKHAHILYL